MHASPVWRSKPPAARAFSKRTGVAFLLAAAGVSFVVGMANLRTSERLLADGLTTRARVSGKRAERALWQLAPTSSSNSKVQSAK